VSLPLQVAFLTGQSDPRSTALSPEQRAFMAALEVPAHACVDRNFPYDAPPAHHRATPIVTASWHNARQYWMSRYPDFRRRYRADVEHLFAGAERTVVLAGSCGLELLANLDLPAPLVNRVHVFAYGPVARRRPSCHVLSVCGRVDWISKALGPRADVEVACGHLDYLRSPEVLTLCRDFVGRVAVECRA